MKNIHKLPTDKPSRLCFRNYYFINKDNLTTYSNVDFKNIYITSDEEIKEGDWVVVIYDNKEKPYIIIKCGKHISGNYKKIILTTDQDLIKDGVQAIDDEFLEWFVKNPSCERVETKLVYDSEDHPELVGNPKEEWSYYEIIIPQEEPKKETLDEAAKKQWGNVHRTGVLGFIDGAKWQEERMYSEKEVESLLHKFMKSQHPDWHGYSTTKWFEQFKKK